MNYILCGMQKSGKSTIGSLLAKKLEWNFIDTDCLIQKSYEIKTNKKFSCREIALHEGEKSFREMEQAQIATLKNTHQSVIAVGGGSIENQENAKILQSIGYLIYLNPSWQLLWQRIKNNGIPAYLDKQFPEKSFYEIAERRDKTIRTKAQLVIDSSKMDEQETLLHILTHLKLIKE